MSGLANICCSLNICHTCHCVPCYCKKYCPCCGQSIPRPVYTWPTYPVYPVQPKRSPRFWNKVSAR